MLQFKIPIVRHGRTSPLVARGPLRAIIGPKSLPLRYAAKVVKVKASSKNVQQDVVAPLTSPEPLLYLEPFVRAFLLGLGSAVLLETAHVALNFVGLMETVGGPGFALDALQLHPNLLQEFAPLFYFDHITALVGWMAFYIIDVVAIKAVLDLYRGDATAAGHALKALVTIPKKMLPLRLSVFKHLVGAAHGTGFAVENQPITPLTQSSSGKNLKGQHNIIYPAPAPLPAPMRDTPANRTATLPPPPMSSNPPANAMRPPSATIQSPTSTTKQREGLAPGQLSPDAAGFLRRRRELADRRSYLTNQWYAAALSESVKVGEPLGVDILGRRVVLFRDSVTNQVKCLDDACPHRGAPLSAGWMESFEGHDCVVCPYHGWALDAEGRLRDVPAATSKGEWPRRSIVPVHHVEERGGFVWLFFGSKDLPADARPPIPYVSELDDASWKAVYGEIEFESNHSAVFDNATDVSHIHYVHSSSFGNQNKPEILDMTAEADEFGVTSKFKLYNKPSSVFWEWTKVPVVEVTATAFLPSTSVISFTLGAGLSFTTFVNTVPISADKTVNRFALVRNLAWDSTGMFNAGAWDAWARNYPFHGTTSEAISRLTLNPFRCRAMLKILGEDKVIVEQLRPDLLQHEYSVRADLLQVAFRKLRQSYVDLGMAVPADGDAAAFDEGADAASAWPDL